MSIQEWIEHTLWSRWGWEGYEEDCLRIPYRDADEKRRIQGAVEFTIRALGNNRSPDSWGVIDAIIEERGDERVRRER